jgi:hypothetical protein
MRKTIIIILKNGLTKQIEAKGMRDFKILESILKYRQPFEHTSFNHIFGDLNSSISDI